ncbi:hypothetical protein P4198_00870 [Pseudomonas aeruginosa]|nr:hypothetical protein [Pseudomonas aeruginosa]
MKTLDLQGNLLNLYVALAMGGFDESSGSWAPFDYWEGTIRYRNQEFSPLPRSGLLINRPVNPKLSASQTYSRLLPGHRLESVRSRGSGRI